MMLDKAEKLRMSYIPFQFPIGADDDKVIFTFRDPKSDSTFDFRLLLSNEGMTLLLQNLYEHVDRNKAKGLYQKDLKEFAEYINTCRQTQETDDLWRKGQVYTLAVNNDIVYGMVVNYNQKPNVDVLAQIAESGLTVTRQTINTKEMNVYISYRTKDGFELGLHVRNGETGYASLSYRLYVYNNTNQYTFSTPTFGRRKHLSLMDEVDENLNNLYAEIKNISFHEFILEAESKEYAQIILSDEKFEKLWELVEPYNSRLKKLYALLGLLHSQASIRGWKTPCNKALDKIYTLIMEKI